MRIKRRTVLQGLAATGAAIYAPAVVRAQGAAFKIGLLTVKTCLLYTSPSPRDS